jgi:mRNA interferase MazF
MIKDYTRWFSKKSVIQQSSNERVFFHEKEIWWCSTGSNVGSEEDGKGEDFARPVLIFKKFNKGIFWAIPLTTKINTNEKNSKF